MEDVVLVRRIARRAARARGCPRRSSPTRGAGSGRDGCGARSGTWRCSRCSSRAWRRTGWRAGIGRSPGPDDAGARGLPQGAAARHGEDAARRRDRPAARAPALSGPGAAARSPMVARGGPRGHRLVHAGGRGASRCAPGWATSWDLRPQASGDLGARLAAAAHAVPPGRGWLAIGADCPRLDAALLREAAPSSRETRSCSDRARTAATICSAAARRCPTSSARCPWSTSRVLAETRARLMHAQASPGTSCHPARCGHRGGRARRRTLDLIPGRGPYWPTPVPRCLGARGWPGESSSTTTGDGMSRLPPNVAPTRRTGIWSSRSGRRSVGQRSIWATYPLVVLVQGRAVRAGRKDSGRRAHRPSRGATPVNRPPVRPVSLQDLRRIAETLAALRDRSVIGAVMRSDRRQLRVEMGDGHLLVVGVDLDPDGRPAAGGRRLRPAVEHGNQLEVRFESA